MQVAFYQVVQHISEQTGKELTVADITSTFQKTYFLSPNAPRLSLRSFTLYDSSAPTPAGTPSPDSDDESSSDRRKSIVAKIAVDGMVHTFKGEGNGPLSSLIDALANHLGLHLSIREYSEHAVGGGSSVKAASFVELIGSEANPAEKGKAGFWGVGIDPDIGGSGLRAILSAASRSASSSSALVLTRRRRGALNPPLSLLSHSLVACTAGTLSTVRSSSRKTSALSRSRGGAVDLRRTTDDGCGKRSTCSVQQRTAARPISFFVAMISTAFNSLLHSSR